MYAERRRTITIPSLAVLLTALLLASCSSRPDASEKAAIDGAGEATTEAKKKSSDPRIGTEPELADYERAYFASGCFWCVEAIFESVIGVEEAVSGYAGGSEPDPTYEQVSRGATTHAEAVEVFYDPDVVDYATLVRVFFGSHDPTTVNGQAPDFGPQYRSMILTQNDDERKIALSFRKTLATSGAYDRPIATEIVDLEKFYPAELYHQDYELRNPDEPYIRRVSVPRLERFKAKFPELVRDVQQPH